MDYLMQKLDFRQKKIIKFKNLFKELDSFESFYAQRKEIYLLLNNLEEDLKQASYAIKALLLQNKSLINEMNIRISENKKISNELNISLGENQNLKMKLEKLENIRINENKMNEINNYQMNNNDLVNVNIESIKVDDEEEYEEPKVKNIDLKYNSNSKLNTYNDENEEINTDNNYEQLSNVKNIMKEMRNNKKNLKRIIEEHFKEQNEFNDI